MKQIRALFVTLLVMLGFMASAQAAAPDTTELIADIGLIGVAIVAIIGALLAMSTSIFGISKVYAFIKRKAGA